MTAIGIDLGATLGWMKGGTVGPIEKGEIKMPNTSKLGPWLAELDNHLPKLLRGVKTIGIEQPFLGEDYYPARKLLGQLGMIYYHAHHVGISSDYIEEIAVPTAKLTMAGHGRAEKEQMTAAAAEFWGFDLEEMGEHEADAGAILRVHLFGARQKIRPARVRSSKGVSLTGRGK